MGSAPLELEAEADGAWLRARSPEAERAALIAALRDGDHLELAAGDAAPVTVSLRGATAAMLMIDDRQWRIGTVSALARPGDAPAASVAPAAGAPAVDARPIRAIDATAARGRCRGRRSELRQRRPGRLRSRRRDARSGARAIEGAYNAVYPLLDRRAGRTGPGGVRRARAPRSAPALLTGPALTADGGARGANLGRGVGDCGEASRWAWTGDAFALVRLAGLDICAGRLARRLAGPVAGGIGSQLPNTDHPVRWTSRSSATTPSREFPARSRPGDQTQIAALPGATARMPPPTPLFAGNPTR